MSKYSNIPPSALSLPPSSLILSPNPFPGLRPFRSDEHHLFFGREAQTAALLQLLRTNRFLAVVGTSGSGKSSLVRAGMIAELHGGTMTQAGSAWEVMILRPGGSPIENLARAFVEADLYDAEDPSTLPRLLATLNRSRFGLVEAMKQCDLFEPGTNLLVVVDQFEELFRFRQQGGDSEETAAAFVNLLLTASEQAECPIYVTVTMRSDYLGDCSEIPGLAEAVNDGEYLIPRLQRDAKRDAVEKPIGVGGAKISSMLVQRLLNEVGDDPDQLPVLQHALMRMWEAWTVQKDHARPIDISDFEATGGLASALSNHADEIYDLLPSDHHRFVCEKIFKTLTEKGDDNRGIRRPTRLSHLQTIANSDRSTAVEVLDAFRGAGVTFLMPGVEVELRDRTVIDLSHESLMRGWQRLRGWVEEEAQSARIFRRLLDTARLWADGKAGLFRNPDLQIALSWREQESPNAPWSEQYGGHIETAIRFLDTSNADVEAEQQAKEAARQRELTQAQELAEARQLQLQHQQRTTSKLRKLIAGVAGVALVAGIACVLALVANNRAEKLAVVASLAKNKAELNEKAAEQAKRGTELALTQVEAEKGRAEENLRKAELAEKRSREFRYSTDIELAARMVNDKTANAAQLTDRLDDFDPKMSKGLAATDDMRGFEWYYLKKLLDSRSSVFSGFNKPVIAAAMTPEGVLVSLDEEAQVRRFDAVTKQERGAPTDLKKGRNIGTKTLSPDGQRVAIASGNEVQIFDAVSGEQIGRSIPSQVRGGLIFSPDSRMLITRDTGIGWWDAATCKPIAVQDFQLTIFDNVLQPLSTSADGLTLAVGGQGTYSGAFSVFKLNVETREITRLLDKIGAQGTKRALAISPDGGTVAISLYFQGGIYVYETATGKLLQMVPSAHSSAISAIAFRQDSTEMVTASLDGTIKLWNDYRKLDPDKANTFVGHAEEVNVLAILPGGKQLLSASSDKSVRVWSLGESKTDLHQKLAGAIGSPSASFSPDGMLIATPGGLTGNSTGSRLRIWDAATGQPAMEFPKGSRADISADSVAFSPDGRLLAAGYGGVKDVSYIELWDIDRRERIGVLPGSTAIPGFTTDENSGTIPGLAFSPDGKHLIAAFGSINLMSRGDTGNFPLLVYDVANQQVVRRLEGHRNFCMAVAFSRDGSRMASASQDGTARIWDTSTWRELQVLDNPDTASETGQRRVYDVAFSPNGAMLAMASAEGNVILFDVASGEVLQTLRGHANEVQGVAFAPDGFTLASGSLDGTLRFWNTATWRELIRLEPEKGFAPRSIAFSPNGDRLLACDRAGTLLWSVPRDGSTSRTTTEQLAKLLDSNIDFRHRIRLLSDDLQLHEPLQILAQREPNRAEVQAALAATRANWYADRSEWQKSVEQFDLLREGEAPAVFREGEAPAEPAQRELRPPNSGANVATQYLRTPGLLRLATALFHEGRSADAALLLIGGETRRAEDGNGTRSDSFGFGFDPSFTSAKLTQVFRGSPAWNGGLRVGDALLKINDIEVTSENRAKYQNAMQNPVEGKLSITFQHSGFHQPETAEIIKASFLQDDLTVELIENLVAAVNQRLSESANDPGLLELRAELAGQSSDFEKQVADYTAAMEALSKLPEDEAAANLARLYRRRGNAYVGLKRWQLAIHDYAKGITAETTDNEVLANQALAQAQEIVDSGAILATSEWDGKDWRYTTTKPTDDWNQSDFDDGGWKRGEAPFGTADYKRSRTTWSTRDIWLRREFESSDELTADNVRLRLACDDIADVFLNGKLLYHQEGNTSERYIEIPLTPDLVRHLSPGRNCVAVHCINLESLGYVDAGLYSGLRDPIREERITKLSLSSRSDPWQRLAIAYLVQDDQQAIDTLVSRRPQASGPIGDLFIGVEDKNWQRAIEIYSKGITPETTDTELFTRRAQAYEGLQDWNAAADWERAARLNPDGAKTLIEFALRLANSDQSELAMVVRDRARSLLETTLASDPENVVAVEQMAGLLLERYHRLEFGLASLDQGAMTRITAIRVETSSDSSPPAGDVPAFSEYQILSTKLPEQGFRGRFVRLDLPGNNTLFPRHPSDKNTKTINLAEFQAFQGDLNIALGKPARQSSPTYPAERAVDGNTVGNDSNNSYAHTGMEENPWWEVDLGSEQAFNRMVVWNRSDVGLYPRMNHFRVQILDANRELVYERVIDRAPAPSTEIRRSVNWSQVAGTNAGVSNVSQLTFNLDKDSEPLARFRVSATGEVLPMATVDRANDTGWVEIPNALNTQSTGSLALDAQTMAKIAQQSRLAQATKIADAPTRLAAAYELAGKPAGAAEQFLRTLDRAQTDAARQAVLKELSSYPEALAELIQQRPRDHQLQIALVRRHVAMGQKELAAKEPNAALMELQHARDLFERLLEQNREPKWTVLQPTEMNSEGGATLALQDDGSILASGKNPDEDTYKLKAPSDLTRITAFRLEALPDPSLPKNGPGRAGGFGNFHLNELRVFSGDLPLALTDIAVTHDEKDQFHSAIDGRVDYKFGWSVYPKSGQTSVAIIATKPDTSTNDPIRFELYFSRTNFKQHNLGRFRLSATDDPDAFTAAQLRLLMPQTELATLDVSIGKAYAQQGKVNDSAIAFGRALDGFEKDEERQTIIETMKEFPTELSILAEQRPQNTPLQLALAKSLAQGGQKALAENRQNEALPQLAKARELFASLAAKNPEPQWTVLQPTEMKSEVGAEMDLQDDGSIFVHHATALKDDTYTLVFESELEGIVGLRLEVLADSRLPGGGPGLGGDGNFLLRELSLQAATGGTPDNARAVALRNALADFSQTNCDVRGAIDGNTNTSWGIFPEMNKNHTAFFELGEKIGDGQPSRLTVRLNLMQRLLLGRFRVSVTSDPNASKAVQFQRDLKSSGLSDLDASFAEAYALQGRPDEAADAYARVLDLAIDLQARAKTIREAAAHAGVLEKLAVLKAEDAPFLDALARHYQQQGELLLARDAAMKARALYEAKLVAQPQDAKLASAIADLLTWASPQEWTVLQPTELQSAGGATLQRLEDGSILASGNNAPGDTYTLVADGDRKISVVRLEVLPDDSLPNKGPGRHPTGNFQLKAIRLFRSNRDTNEDRLPIPLQSAVASFAYSAYDADVRGTIDDSLHKVWHVWGRFGEPHTAQFLLQQPVALRDGEKLTLVLENKGGGDQVNLGRFRISTSSDPGLFDAEKRRNELQQYASTWMKLSAAYQTVGEPEKALATLSRAMELAATDSAKVALAQEAAISEELFAQLLQQSPDDKWLRLGQAKHQGKKLLAEGRTADAVQVLKVAIVTAPNDIDLLNQRAAAYMKLAQWQAAAADYARILELETDNGKRRVAESLLAEVQLRLGDFQAGADGYFERMLLIPNDEWALRDAATAQLLSSNSGISKAVARRFLEKSGSSKNKDLAQWLVRILVARPGLITKENSPKLLEAAKVAESPWTAPMTAAIHYRLGDLPQAEPLLTKTNGDIQFQSLAAMLLYDQGKNDEARALLSNAAAWLDRERSLDPGSVIPRQQSWPTWTVNLIAWREAARKLIGPRVMELDTLLAKEPDNTQELLERARLLADAGFHDDALRDLDRLVALKVDSLEASALHGRILAGLNRNEEALPLLNQAIEAGSQDNNVFAARGTLLLKQDQTEAARADLEKSLKLKPTELAGGSLADLLLAEAQKKSEWTVLKPTEMKSEGGATLTLQADNSVLAGGKNTLGDVYSITAQIAEPVRVTAIRLEALTDPSLPNNGPGRDENRDRGNFDMVGLQATAWVSGSDVLKVPLSRATANHSNHIEVTVQNWNGSGGTGQAQTAWYELEAPLEMETGSRLDFEMRFSANSEWPLQNLGRFRLSVSADLTAFDRERKRLSAMKLTNPWAKLATAYDILGNQSAVSRLLEQHPEIAIGFADIAADAKDWDSAIAAYNRLITPETTDVTLIIKRAAAYIATEQWEQAKADWLRVTELKPQLALTAFEQLTAAQRWNEASQFGLMALAQNPTDSILWLRVSAVAATSGDLDAYAAVCKWISSQPAQTPELADRAIKCCLLRPGAIDIGKMPGDVLARGLDDGTAPDAIAFWYWSSRALLAYRRGDADAAVSYANKSVSLNSSPFPHHALNLAILAMAHHQLNHSEEAEKAFAEGTLLIERLKEDPNNRVHHDVLIPELLLGEAKAKIDGETTPYGRSNE